MFHQYMKEAIDMVVEEFKIVQEFHDKLSNMHGTVTDIFQPENMLDFYNKNCLRPLTGKEIGFSSQQYEFESRRRCQL